MNSSRQLKVALTQWHASRDLSANLAVAVSMVREAGDQDADLVSLPENCLFLGRNAEMREAALSVEGSEIAALRESARAASTTVVLGGFKRKHRNGRIYNTALVIGPDGEVAGGYDKIHLFDANVGGQSFEASSVECRGDAPAILQVQGVHVGLTICYDVRFPELYRQLALAGAEVILVPSAFTIVTGTAHWEVLLRARAIESSAYVVASATIRGADGEDAFPTYGHALAVAPWGEVLEDLGETPRAMKVLTLKLDEVQRVRNALPVLRGTQRETCARKPVVLSVD